MTGGQIQKKFGFLSNRLREARRKQGWSRHELARRIGRAEDDIGEIESGRIKDELGTIYLICHELGLSFKEMFETQPESSVVVPFRRRSGS